MSPSFGCKRLGGSTKSAVLGRQTEAGQRRLEDHCVMPRVLSITAVAVKWSCRMYVFALRFHARDLLASQVYIAGRPTLIKVCRYLPG